MTETNERRRYTRIEFDGEANLSQGDANYPVHLIDVSIKGALIETPEHYEFDVQSPMTLTIQLAGDIAISMIVTMAHSGSSHLGFHCESIDMESVSHLRRLIELNIDDPHASERVLDELMVKE